MIYAVIDTNVFVSAMITHNQESSTVKLYRMLLEGGEITPLFNQEILDEYKEVLSRPHFRVDASKLQSILDAVCGSGIDSQRVPFEAWMPDEDDRVFYEVALSHDGAYLVTGNQKHFPVDPIVVTPAEMLEILAKEEQKEK